MKTSRDRTDEDLAALRARYGIPPRGSYERTGLPAGVSVDTRRVFAQMEARLAAAGALRRR